MGRRSRKARPERAPRPGPQATMRRGYARAEERNAALRAELRPLGPGERPGPLLVAAVVAGLLGAGNLVAYAAGLEVDGERPTFVGVALFSVLMLVAAWGMWQRRYWAVLGFEALLGITVAIATLSLLVASNLAAVALCMSLVVLAGWLFWRLVRVMARIQATDRGPRDAVR